MAQFTWSKLFVKKSKGGMFSVVDPTATPGDVWWVSSTTTGASDTSGYGRNPGIPFATLDYALSVCAAYDTIYMMPDHDEGLANDQWAVAAADDGIQIIGLGIGDHRPRLTFNHANTSLDIAADNVLIRNVVFRPSVTAVLIGVHAAASVLGLMMDNCEFAMGEDGAGTDEFVECVNLAGGNTGSVFVNCKLLTHASAAGSTHGINVAAASNELVFDHVIIDGPFATGGIVEAAAGLNHVVENCAVDVSGTNYSFHADSTFAVRRGNYAGGIPELVPDIAGAPGRGRDYYVDSASGASGNSGLSWDEALATIDQAINKCTHDYGDRIHVAPKHTESFTGAAQAAMDVRGVSVIGYGVGAAMPSIVMADTDGTFAISAANCYVKGLKFVSDIADCVVGLDITATGDGAVIEDCLFMDGAANKELLIAATLEAAADNVSFLNCRFEGIAGSDSTHAIQFEGAADMVRIVGCTFQGEWNTGAIVGTVAAPTRLEIRDCTIVNLDTNAGLGISLHANATGHIVGNRVYGGKTAIRPIVGLAMVQADNVCQTVIGASDVIPGLGIQCVRATGNIAQTGVINLFTIAGGRVRIKAIIGEITTEIGAGANACSLEYTPTAGLLAVLCTTLDIDADTVGTLLSITGNPGDALVRVGLVMNGGIVCEAGTITNRQAANAAGQIQWTCYWEPVESGATVVAA